jgi:hypothetical protein
MKKLGAAESQSASDQIDIREGKEIDAGAFKALVRAAVALNLQPGKAKSG